VIIEVAGKMLLNGTQSDENEVAQVGGLGVNLIAQLQTVFFDFVLEGAAADAKELSCLRSILVGFF
jgi:hypothetical protein